MFFVFVLMIVIAQKNRKETITNELLFFEIIFRGNSVLYTELWMTHYYYFLTNAKHNRLTKNSLLVI